MKRMKPLSKEEFEQLEWDTFSDFKMVRIRTDADGSCFFHALLKGYFKPYIQEEIDGKTFNRRDFVRNLRHDLAEKLAKPIKKGSEKTYYNQLNRGQMETLAEDMPECTLENMQAELGSSRPVSNLYNEFVSNELDIDIYILDGIKRDVYMTGSDDALLYKNRKSVVVLYLPGHYELIGLLHNGEYIETFFSPQSKFINHIRERMNQLRKVPN